MFGIVRTRPRIATRRRLPTIRRPRFVRRPLPVKRVRFTRPIARIATKMPPPRPMSLPKPILKTQPIPSPPALFPPPPPPPLPEPPFHFNVKDYTCGILEEYRQAKKPVVDPRIEELKWPEELRPIFVVSIRIARYLDMMDRMKHWAQYLELFPATDGRRIPYEKCLKSGHIGAHCISHGQLGCYESHVRVWQEIVDRDLPYALVLEDDADVRYEQKTVDVLTQMLKELKEVPDWDIVYIGNISLHPFKCQRTEHLFEMTNWEGTFMYYVSNKGARKFLKHAIPVRIPVDVYMGSQYGPQEMVPLALIPRLAHCVQSISDTDRETF
jgi:glycosyl transferase, family 25